MLMRERSVSLLIVPAFVGMSAFVGMGVQAGVGVGVQTFVGVQAGVGQRCGSSAWSLAWPHSGWSWPLTRASALQDP
jgi:hypothetical protein